MLDLPSATCALPVYRHSSRDILKGDRKSTRLNSSHPSISYAVFCLKKKNIRRKTSRSYQNCRPHNQTTVRQSKNRDPQRAQRNPTDFAMTVAHHSVYTHHTERDVVL